jgi:N-acetylmuramoyl-L-alanine amidase-like protein
MSLLEVVGGAQWCQAAAAEQLQPRDVLRRLILHHTAIPDPLLAAGDLTAETAYMKRIERLHLDRGWAAVGYHFVIMPSGRVYSGRPPSAIGAHAQGSNRDSIGIALAGDFEREPPDPAAIASLRALAEDLAPTGRPLPLIAHGDLMPTACPGRLLRMALEPAAGTAAPEL